MLGWPMLVFDSSWRGRKAMDEPDPIPENPFLKAIALGSLEEVRATLAEGATIKATVGGGYEPLAWAACRGRTDVIQLLVARGASIEGEGSPGLTPLMEAARCGQTGAVRLLLELGADVHRPASDRSTALHWAATSGSPATVRLLLDSGADPGTVNNAGLTPIAVAKQGAYISPLQRLLRHSPDPLCVEIVQMLTMGSRP
jgi:uncharacterized protein